MSFSSFAFIAAFLPVVVVMYFLIQRISGVTASRLWLVVASLVFYGFGGLQSLPVIAGSVLFNYCMVRLIAQAEDPLRRKRILIVGVTTNILLLVIFKYTGFVAGNVAFLSGVPLQLPRLGLPLGISFFTLQQVMLLMDCYERLTPPFSFLDHALFQTFFPYVTMGPIVRARDVKPTLTSEDARRPNWDHIAIGIYLFAIGLFKKAVIADSFGQVADAGFDYAGKLSLVEAWLATLSFTFQLYFDFSGYTDMAIAAALMLNFKLPQNFNSPLKATSIIEFWHRWHITLSNFITTYLYTPLVRLQEKVTFNRAMLMTVLAMAIAGLWHGAAWTFVIFGTLHGCALVVNHIWKKKKRKMPRALGWLLTLLFVNFAFVFFRAVNIGQAFAILGSMFSSVLTNPHGAFEGFVGFDKIQPAIIALIGLIACFGFDNSNQLAAKFKPSIRSLAFVVATLLLGLLFVNGVSSKEFVYRDF